MDWFPETVSAAPSAGGVPAAFVEVMPFDGGGKSYTYRVPEKFAGKIALGSLVKIPLGSRVNFGVVWKLDAVPAPEWAKKIRDLSELCGDVPVLTPDALKLCEWISAYYAAPLNSVLLTLLPNVVRRGVRPVTEKKISLARKLSPEELGKLRRRAKKQAALYDFLAEKTGEAAFLPLPQNARNEKKEICAKETSVPAENFSANPTHAGSDKNVASPAQTFPRTAFFDPQTKIEISQANLPHWEQGEKIYFSTFRLADSVPNEIQKRWREDALTRISARTQSDPEAQKKFCAEVEKILEKGFGECLFRKAEIRELVEKTLCRFDGERYTLYAFVVMPNHVHVLFQPKKEKSPAEILRNWKGFSAYAVNRALKRTGTLWQKESWDRIIRNEHHFRQCVEYICENPGNSGIPVFLNDAAKVFAKTGEAAFLPLPQNARNEKKEICAKETSVPAENFSTNPTQAGSDKSVASPRAFPRAALPFSAAVIDALVAAGIAKEEISVKSRLAYDDDFDGGVGGNAVRALPPTLNAEQQAALDSVCASLDEKKFRTHLLHGVTGSGKTEVYIGAIRRALDSGGSAIFLVPEVALTPQTVERLRSRLADCATQIVVWHSNLSDGERYDAWLAMARGNARLLVGARSAIFAPLKNLRLIVVDEEHEPSFKQSETPFYHGRDVAVFRAHLCGAVCVLGSATPSLESFFNAKTGKYILNRIEKRVDDRAFPPMKIIDMRREILHSAAGQTTFSRPMLDALRERLERREQSILFLNRRGYSRALICPDCGHVVTCPHCSAPLTYHRAEELMRCHLCDHVEPAATRCPACGSPKIRKRGFGTQRAEEILKNIFPDAVAVRLDADTMSKKNEFRKILGDFRAGKIDILLGTQMIAKGLDFPRVTLAGILDADLSLHVPDFRAAERTFQLLVQVAGRAGRGDLEGEVLVQTFTPAAAPIQFAKRAEFDEFLEDELARRKEFGYPPLRHVIRHLFRGNDAALVEETADRWTDFLEKHAPDLCEIRGPAPCPTEKIQDNYRFHVWYFCENVVRVSARLVQLRAAFPFPQNVIELLDVDPADVG